MRCPRCGSENISFQLVSETQIKVKHHGILWWMFIGIWWVPVKWILFTIPALIVKIFAPKRYKTKTIHRSMAVCQNCGNHWRT